MAKIDKAAWGNEQDLGGIYLPPEYSSYNTSNIKNKNRVVTSSPPGLSGNQFNVGRQYHACMGGWPPMARFRKSRALEFCPPSNMRT